jgi:hypothetical protein
MPSDPMTTYPIYPSDNSYGIPNLRHTPLSAVPDWLIPYRTRVRFDTTGGAVHFFLYDAIFRSVWTCPNKSARYLSKFRTVLTPDFSLDADMPLALQIFNTYRNRWCGAHWQAQGYTVIPTVGWSTPESFVFCFAGIARHSVVALTTLGTRRNRDTFMHGFQAMIDAIQPSMVMCYGDPFPEMERVPLHVYPDRWQGIRAARNG